MKPAGDPDTPRHWEKRVLAAYYRLLGSSQKAAGAAVGRSERSVWTWEQDTVTWTQATEEARKRWLGEVTALARRLGRTTRWTFHPSTYMRFGS